MKITSSLSAAVLALCVLTPHAFATTYQSANGYQITVPDNFVSRPATGTLQNDNVNIKSEFDSMFIGPHKEFVSVVIENAPPGVTLSMLSRYLPSFVTRNITSSSTQVSINGFSTLQNKTRARILSKRYTTIGGVKAFTMLGRMDATEGSVLTRQVFVIRHGWLMTFSCSAPAKNFGKMAPAFNRTLTTVRWTR